LAIEAALRDAVEWPDAHTLVARIDGKAVGPEEDTSVLPSRRAGRTFEGNGLSRDRRGTSGTPANGPQLLDLTRSASLAPAAPHAAMGHTRAMSSSAASAPYTWDDFVALEEDDLRELIDGELVEVEVPRWKHEWIVGRLVVLLDAWAQAGRGGRVVPSGYKLRISDRRGVMPDVQFYRQGNDAPLDQDDGLTRGRPDLVVEVVSPSSQRFDRVIKLRWYAGLGIPEYWLVDPTAKTLEQLVLREGAYVIAASLVENEAFRPASFDGLEISLSNLWR
jgi:Uma2 family endonuclease